MMRRLAVIPNDPLGAYVAAGYGEKWLREYFNPMNYFDEVYALSPHETGQADLLGLTAIHTPVAALHTRLKALKVDVVRAYGGAFPCEVAGRNKVRGIPVVVSVHDTRPGYLRDWIDKADVVWCVSEAVRRLVLTKIRDGRRVWILPNRVHFDAMRPYGPEETRDLDQRYPFTYNILHVGRKTREKNLATLIQALAYLGKEYCLLAVGKGDPAGYLAMARQAGVLSQCVFIDAIHHDELARYFSWADCTCMPSRWEGSSLVILEALAAEAILVASAIPPMAEVITHLHNGLLVNEYENPRALSEMIRLACTDQGVRTILQRNARASVARFEQSRVDALEVGYYKQVLAMNAQGAFRMPLWERMASTALGRAVREATPVPIRAAARHLIGPG